MPRFHSSNPISPAFLYAGVGESARDLADQVYLLGALATGAPNELRDAREARLECRRQYGSRESGGEGAFEGRRPLARRRKLLKVTTMRTMYNSIR